MRQRHLGRGFRFYLLTGLILCFILPSTVFAVSDILDELNDIQGMAATEIVDNLPDGYRGFRLQYKQPVDHKRPHGKTYVQHLTLLHKDTAAPMIFRTSGYYNYSDTRLTELSRLLDCNQISVEHRYFGNSYPTDKIKPRFCTIRQAAGDHHRIIKAIRPLYDHRSKWVSTGASKGGMTASYHRRFYPRDVDATVAYVAPNSFGKADWRYVPFVMNIGDSACRDKLIAIQREALKRRDEMVPLIEKYFEDSGTPFTMLPDGADRALDIIVSEFLFQFYQYGTEADCDTIPEVNDNTTSEEILAFLGQHFYIGFLGDPGLEQFKTYYYQAAVQLGYCRLPTRHLRGLLKYDPNDYDAYLQDLMPLPHFDYMAMIDMAFWVFFRAEKMMFIYGENDPWSAAAYRVQPHNCRQTYLFTVPKGNHGSAIAQLPEAEKKQALRMLEKWTGVKPVETPLRGYDLREELPMPPRM